MTAIVFEDSISLVLQERINPPSGEYSPPEILAVFEGEDWQDIRDQYYKWRINDYGKKCAKRC